MAEELAAEFLITILFNGLADALHQSQQVAQIVDGRQPSAGDFSRLDEVADIRAGEIPAGVAVAAFLDRAEIVGILRVSDDQPALIGEAGAVARNAVASTQSNMSMPRYTPSTRQSGLPTPIR